jgi:hypothetical protein
MSELTCFKCGDGNTPLYCLNCANEMRQSELSATICSVFEAVDASSDEQYYTCGIWTTLEAAMKAFQKLGDDYPGEDIADGVKIIEIRERKIGELDWSENGKVVAKFVWRKDYRESDDSYEWRLTETITPNVKAQRPAE